MKTLTLDDDTYDALNSVLDYVLEHKQQDYDENPFSTHVFAHAQAVADALDAQADEQPVS